MSQVMVVINCGLNSADLSKTAVFGPYDEAHAEWLTASIDFACDSEETPFSYSTIVIAPFNPGSPDENALAFTGPDLDEVIEWCVEQDALSYVIVVTEGDNDSGTLVGPLKKAEAEVTAESLNAQYVEDGEPFSAIARPLKSKDHTNTIINPKEFFRA